jgi:hypothetical protein
MRASARSSPNVPLGKVGSRFSQFGPQGGRPPWPAAQVVKSFQYLLTDPRQFDILKSALAGPGPNASRSIETARVHIAARRHGGGVAACGARAAAGHTGDWIFGRQVAGGCVWPRCCCRTSGRPIARSRCAPITSMAIAVDSSTIRAMIVTVARSFERSAAKPDRVHGVAEG